MVDMLIGKIFYVSSIIKCRPTALGQALGLVGSGDIPALGMARALGQGTGVSPFLGALGQAAGLGFADLDAVEAALAKRLTQSDDLAGGGVAIEAQVFDGFPVAAAEVVGGLDGDVAVGGEDELEFAAPAVRAD